MDTHATIFIGGFAPHTRAYDAVIDRTLLIAADSGWEHAMASGRRPHILVGDMDSIRKDHLEQARQADTVVITHPTDKDHTDTELALQTAVERGATHITVVAGGGDRPDHVVAMLHSLAARHLASVRVDGWLGSSRFIVCRSGEPTVLDTSDGDIVSLVPIGGDATVSTSGVKWQLDHDVLHAHASRGVSNQATGNATVTVHEGNLIAFITQGDNQ